jgi:putative Mg2+ transporter-C (MgtC) family protein
MSEFHIDVLTRLLLALLAGSLIGLERTLHGRPAGFRTHAIVSISCAMLMMLGVYYERLMPPSAYSYMRMDPTRMAQGIMTGIGFLGAGVIIKEAYSVRGLTTSASIWTSSSIGIMIGAGFYFIGFSAVAISLASLSLFRYVEDILPSMQYAKLTIVIDTRKITDEEEIFSMIKRAGAFHSRPGYTRDGERHLMKYSMTLRSRRANAFKRLSDNLNLLDSVREFDLLMIG